MRTLEQALNEHDLIVLRVIGEWLGIDLTGSGKAAAVNQLTSSLLQVNLPQEMEFLEPDDAQALQELVRLGGRVPVAVFARDYGEVRMMGPGRLEREEPWLDPTSPTESLWYRGYLYRGFDETPEGPIEFFFLPQELLAQFNWPVAAGEREHSPKGTIAPAPNPPTIREAVTDAVDDLTTLLALAQRTGLRSEKLPNLDGLMVNPDRDRRSLLLTLATEMSLLRRANDLLRPTRSALNWLRLSREAQLRSLVDAWSRSIWNELRHTPGLICEGESWNNDPLPARTALMDVLPGDDNWYLLSDIVEAVRNLDPDFQRPDGNYDTWFIRDAEMGGYLSGFENWDEVEGRLLHYLVQGPLFWLGMVDLSDDDDPPTAYRLTARALAWLGDEPPGEDEIRVPFVVLPEGILVVPHNAGRFERFQAARIADPEPLQPGTPYRYRLVPSSLVEAREQGILPERILVFLEEGSGRPVPTSVRRGLKRWADKGVEGRLQGVVVLRVADQSIIETLRTNSKTREFLGENLGDLAIVVRGEWEDFRQATAQLGLFLDIESL
ncbi:MAG: helicase-associated domain-containing protein [Chloroflexota bacterium]|jgi:hypothetical protein